MLRRLKHLPRLTSRRPFMFYAAALFLVALLASGCSLGLEYPQNSINPKSDFAQGIHELYIDVFWWTIGILVVTWGALAYILFRFREKEGAPHPEQVHGSMALEVAWTIAPAIIVVLIAIPTIRGVFETQRPISEDAMIVEVVGKRFWWQFHYPELGVTTSNELYLPVDQPVSLRLASDDVIHSFWVPVLGGKRDVNPISEVREGEEKEYNWLYFTPNETGTFWGQCAEFCGDSHALMGFRTVVQTQEDFDQWVADWQTPAPTAVAQVPDTIDGVVQQVAAEDPLVAEGRDIFLNQSFCTACHAINGTQTGPVNQTAPNLTRVGSRSTIAAGLLDNDAENLFNWIKNPQAIKPGALMPSINEAAGGWPATGLTDDQINALVAYLLSMR